MEQVITSFAITLDFQTGTYTNCSLDTKPFVGRGIPACLPASRCVCVYLCYDKKSEAMFSKRKRFSCFGWEFKELLGESHAYLKFKACLIHEESCENLSKLIYGTEENPRGGKTHWIKKATSCSLKHFPSMLKAKANQTWTWQSKTFRSIKVLRDQLQHILQRRSLKISFLNWLLAQFTAASQFSQFRVQLRGQARAPEPQTKAPFAPSWCLRFKV